MGDGKRWSEGKGRDGGNKEEKNRETFTDFGSVPQKPLNMMCMVMFACV